LRERRAGNHRHACDQGDYDHEHLLHRKPPEAKVILALWATRMPLSGNSRAVTRSLPLVMGTALVYALGLHGRRRLRKVGASERRRVDV
jgi:hypothetical protein